MAEQSNTGSILGAIGVASTIGAAGIAGYHTYGSYQDVKSAYNNLDIARTAMKTVPVTEHPAVFESNMDSLGFNKVRLGREEFLTLDSWKPRGSSYYDDVIKYTAGLTGHSFKVVQFSNGAVQLKFSLPGMKKNINFGMLSQNGKILHAQSGKQMFSYVPGRFFSAEGVDKILNQDIPDVNEFLKNHTMNFEQYKISEMNRIWNDPDIPKSRKYKTIKNRISEINSKYILNSLDASPTGYEALSHMNSVIAPGLKSGQVADFYDQLYAKVYDRIPGSAAATFLQSPDAIVDGKFTAWDADFGDLNPYKTDRTIGHKFNQAFKKSTFFDNGSSIANINTFYISEHDTLFNELMASGYATDGRVMHGLGDEGFFMNDSLANQHINNRHRLEIKPQGHLDPSVNKFFDPLLTYYQTHSKNLSHNYLTSNYGEQLRQFLASGELQEALLEVYKSKTPRVGNLMDLIHVSDTGKIRMPRNAILEDIVLQDSGFAFLINEQGHFGDSGKSWGSIKAVATGRMSNKAMRESMIAMMAFSHAQKGGMSEEAIRDLLTRMRKGYKSARAELDNIVGAFRNQLTDTSILDGAFRITRMQPSKKESILKKITHDLTGFLFRDTKDEMLRDFMGTEGNVSIRRDLLSPERNLNEYRTGNNVAVNDILIDSLKASGQNQAAMYVENELLSQQSKMRSLWQDYAPLFDGSRLDKNYVGLPINMLTDDDIKSLTSSNTKTARETAERLASGLKRKPNVSDATRYYVYAGNKRVPISLTDSAWTFTVNHRHLLEAEENIRTVLAGHTNSALRGLRDYGADADLWHLKQAYTDIFTDPGNYTRDISTKASLKMAQDGKYLDEKFIQMMRESEATPGAVDDVLAKYGIKNGAEHRGYSQKTFWQKAERTELYKTELEKFSGMKMDDIGKMDSGARRDLIQRFRSERGADLMKEGIVSEITTRNPAYGHGAVGVEKAVDMQAYATDLFMTQKNYHGYRDLAEKDVAAQLSDDHVYLNRASMTRVMADLDNDAITSIQILEENYRNLILTEASTVKKPLVAQLYSRDKGMLKKSILGEESVLHRKLAVMKENIGSIFNAYMPYSQRYNQELATTLKDGVHLSAFEKAAAFDQFAVNLPEWFITNAVQTEADASKIHSIFDSSAEMKTRLDNFLEIINRNTEKAGGEGRNIWTLDDGKNLFTDYMDRSDIEDWLRRGDEAFGKDPNRWKFTQKRAGMDELQNIVYGMMRNAGADNARIRGALNVLAEDTAGLRRTQSMANEVLSDVMPKLAKSKALWATVGAGAVMGWLLRPAANAMKHQEVREESHPKSMPTAAAPINPPTASVFTPKGMGRRLSITGALPKGTGADEIRRQLSGLGFGNQNTVIDRSNTMDEQTVKRLRDEDKYNRWDRG